MSNIRVELREKLQQYRRMLETMQRFDELPPEVITKNEKKLAKMLREGRDGEARAFVKDLGNTLGTEGTP